MEDQPVECELTEDDNRSPVTNPEHHRHLRPAHHPAGWALTFCLAFAGAVWALVIFALIF